MRKISIVVPCYNEEKVLAIFYNEIKKIMLDMNYLDFEIILVNDGSTDATLELFKVLTKKDSTIKYLSFSRKFGKEAAMYAGLKEATGDYIAIMNSDLNVPPSLLTEMYTLIREEDYDCVVIRKISKKKESKIRSFLDKKLHKLMNKLFRSRVVNKETDFRLMTRQVLDSILEVSEYNRFSKDTFDFVGYNTKWLPYESVENIKYSFKELFIKLFKKITTSTPIVIIGTFLCLIGAAIIIIRNMIYADILNDTLGIIIFVSGMQLLSMGIITQNLVKKHIEVKNKRLYVIKETNR